jgi:hypothetical protein
MPRNWDVKMPGTLSISKPCDKCRRNYPMTKITATELTKNQRLPSKEYQCGFEESCGPDPKQEGQLE